MITGQMIMESQMSNLKHSLKEMIVRELRLPDLNAEDIDDDTPLFGQGMGLDSLDAVELVVLVQKQFGVQIADMEEGRDAFQSINTLASFIEHRRTLKT